jgi:methyl-accepting chemotaxis protein
MAGLTAKEIESKYTESKWPFEALSTISENEDFLFWWVLKGDGIYLADKVSFIGTASSDYFPKVDNKLGDKVYLNYKQNYGIFIKSVNTGQETLYLWLGFSLKEIQTLKMEIIISVIAFSLLSILILGVSFYFVISHFTKPIQMLSECAVSIKKGNLNKKCEIKADDELSVLADSFDEMRLGIKDRNDLLNSLLKTFQGKFGNLATILVRKNVQELVDKNQRIKSILPKSLRKSIKKSKE